MDQEQFASSVWSKDNKPEDHTKYFLNHFPDCSLCFFYYTSLNEQSKAGLPGDPCWKKTA